jgi:hypothetical protein
MLIFEFLIPYVQMEFPTMHSRQFGKGDEFSELMLFYGSDENGKYMELTFCLLFAHFGMLKFLPCNYFGDSDRCTIIINIDNYTPEMLEKIMATLIDSSDKKFNMFINNFIGSGATKENLLKAIFREKTTKLARK